jgi:hypothetical protein
MKGLSARFLALESAKLQADLSYLAWAKNIASLSDTGGCPTGVYNVPTWEPTVVAEKRVKGLLAAYIADFNSLAPSFGLKKWNVANL